MRQAEKSGAWYCPRLRAMNSAAGCNTLKQRLIGKRNVCQPLPSFAPLAQDMAKLCFGEAANDDRPFPDHRSAAWPSLMKAHRFPERQANSSDRS